MNRYQPFEKCQICGSSKHINEVVPAKLIRSNLLNYIKTEHPDFSLEGCICYQDLNKFREDYIRSILKDERGELSQLETSVLDSLKESEILSKNLNSQFERKFTLGQRIADTVAEFGGSWRFIILFGVVMLLWITINSVAFTKTHFDPFPYILLNLVLSCLAAIQAPIIMMSQNRQEEKDRMRSENDYSINLKAELEIRHMTEKMDLLINHQWQRLMEIQQIQVEMLEDLQQIMPISPSK